MTTNANLGNVGQKKRNVIPLKTPKCWDLICKYMYVLLNKQHFLKLKKKRLEQETSTQ